MPNSTRPDINQALYQPQISVDIHSPMKLMNCVTKSTSQCEATWHVRPLQDSSCTLLPGYSGLTQVKILIAQSIPKSNLNSFQEYLLFYITWVSSSSFLLKSENLHYKL